MASSKQSSFGLNEHEPDNFDQKTQKDVHLIFEGFAESPRLGFRSITTKTRVPVDVSEELTRVQFRVFNTIEEFKEAFYDDIIIEADTLINISTIGDLLWSKKVDAIMTRESRKRLYGDLLYKNVGQGRWQERETHSEPTCRHIKFKAKLNDNPRIDAESRHKFSYNVRVRNKNNHMIEFEIDPDIQNPKARKDDSS